MDQQWARSGSFPSTLLKPVGGRLEGQLLLTNHDLDALYLVVADSVRVPGRGQRLNVARRVRRPAAELVLTRLIDLPRVAPRLPGELATVPLHLGLRPGIAAIGTDFDANDAPSARPGSTVKDAGPEPEPACSRQEIGDPGRHHQRARQHPGHGLAQLVPGAGDVVGGLLLVTAEGPCHHRDRSEPLHVGHAVPSRHHEAQWKPVLRRERLPVDRIGEEDLLARGLGHAEAALIVLLDTTLNPAVHSGEHDLEGALEWSRLFQQWPQGCARPLRGTDRLEQPRLAQRARREIRAAVAGTLERP